MVYKTGLRERKKRQTRLALVDAALDLFLEHGYDNTTVDQIAAAVDVSPRTFFRYFAGKEELLTHYMDDAERVLVAELAARPEGEPPFTAMTHAFRAFLTFLESAPQSNSDQFIKVQRIVEANPVLMASNIARISKLEAGLAAEIARRQGSDVATDPRPRLVVAMVSAAVRVGFMCPPKATFDVKQVVRQVNQALTLAEQALHPDWDEEREIPRAG